MDEEEGRGLELATAPAPTLLPMAGCLVELRPACPPPPRDIVDDDAAAAAEAPNLLSPPEEGAGGSSPLNLGRCMMRFFGCCCDGEINPDDDESCDDDDDDDDNEGSGMVLVDTALTFPPFPSPASPSLASALDSAWSVVAVELTAASVEADAAEACGSVAPPR